MSFQWLSGTARLLVTLCLVILAVTLPLELWPATACLAIVVFIGHTLARIPLRDSLRRLALFLPVVCMLSLSIPALEGFERGFDLAVLILIRSTISFMAVLWLIRVLPIPELLSTLRGLNVPTVVVSSLSFMYRYSFLLWHELERMRLARRTRSFGRRSIWREWTISAQLVGMLLLRAFDRAERVHLAMLARGSSAQSETGQVGTHRNSGGES